MRFRITDDILAMARPTRASFEEYSLLDQFKLLVFIDFFSVYKQWSIYVGSEISIFVVFYVYHLLKCLLFTISLLY